MVPIRTIPVEPGSLTYPDLPWIIEHREDRCTLCGHCTTVCPKECLHLAYRRQRMPRLDVLSNKRGSEYRTFTGIRQRTDMAHACIGCGMCAMVCPNEAIMPVPNSVERRTLFFTNQKGEAAKRGGRRNAPGATLLDRIIFDRISMLTDPALDAGRHEFTVTTTIGRILSPEDYLARRLDGGWIPTTREVFPFIIGSMSFGALSPNMWLGLLQGVAYCNEVLGIPVVMCTGEGGCPPWVLKSPYLKYIILQIASGYFGWDEIIRAIPEMQCDPAAIEIKYGQGAKPGDGGLLMWYKVSKLIARLRGVPEGVDLPSPPVHQTLYSIEESVMKMIQTLSMAFGHKVPVYPKISASTSAKAVLNNLVRNPYAGGLLIDGIDGGTGAAYNVSMDATGHPVASNVRECYLDLCAQGMQNELPIYAAGGIGKNGNVAQNGMALIMLGASAVHIGKYIMQATAGCLGNEQNRCNVCNLGICPKGITSQNPKLYRRLDPDQVAERVAETFMTIQTEVKKIMAPLGRSQSLPIGMSDAIGISDKDAADRLQIKYVC
ncbi:glutamate synthase-related protein [Desulfofustis limnaeus]|jgi:glutamate synthase (NADPH/NADH) large chain|uniref:glutamate synthase (NADPH) n=1 Tax=Desulfofustis limnaeus TaxID=2740163 RepID=A0ABM7W9Z9_9BACT|nr:glutamate synthase-related protein [Desulfofustis limnaeus]MDX9896258.1 glutamate synthase-related protein [Desulfofustis sp.]BDD87802.1 glutamate synthase [Desulfofustis limnaeus]